MDRFSNRVVTTALRRVAIHQWNGAVLRLLAVALLVAPGTARAYHITGLKGSISSIDSTTGLVNFNVTATTTTTALSDFTITTTCPLLCAYHPHQFGRAPARIPLAFGVCGIPGLSFETQGKFTSTIKSETFSARIKHDALLPVSPHIFRGSFSHTYPGKGQPVGNVRYPTQASVFVQGAQLYSFNGPPPHFFGACGTGVCQQSGAVWPDPKAVPRPEFGTTNGPGNLFWSVRGSRGCGETTTLQHKERANFSLVQLHLEFNFPCTQPCPPADPDKCQTGTGTCDVTTGQCQYTALGDGAPCNADSNGCTVGDSCQGGVCTSGPAANCDDGLSCTTDTVSPLGIANLLASTR